MGQLVAGGRDELLRGRVVPDAVLEQPQLQRDPDQALLRAVVQVALEPPPLGVAGGDDPLARGLELGQLRLGLGEQPRVVDRDRGRRRDRLDQLGIVVERRVVDERAERAAVALDAGHRSLAAGLHHHRRAVGADVAAGVRAPVDDREIGIAERAGECGAQLVRARAADAAEQVGERAARQAGAQLPHQERDRHRQQRNAVTHSSGSERSPVTRSLASSAPNMSSVNAPAMLGSSARRRGVEARHQRTAITDHGRGQRREQQGALRAVEHVRDVLVGERQQQVVALELGEQQPDDLQQHERHGVGDQQPWFDARAHATAREQGQQQRHVEEDPHVDQEVPDGEGERAVDLAQQRRDEEREAGRGHQHARVAVRALVPGEQPGDRERPADEPEDDVDAGDRHVGVDHQRAEHEHLADQREGQQDGEEDEAVAVDLDGRPRGDRGLAVPCHSERRSQDQSRLLTGPWLRATLTRFSAPGHPRNAVSRDTGGPGGEREVPALTAHPRRSRARNPAAAPASRAAATAARTASPPASTPLASGSFPS